VPTCWPGRGDSPADTRRGDLVVQFGDQLIEVGRVIPGSGGLVAVLLGFGAQDKPPLLIVGGRSGGEVGFVLEVPAFPALGGPQGLGPFRARGADRRQRVPAGDEHLLDLAGIDVAAAELDRADARALLHGYLADDIADQRHGHPLGPGCPGHRGARHTDHLSFGHCSPPSGPACQVTDQPQLHCSVTDPSA
jgi:hypothetical protein